MKKTFLLVLLIMANYTFGQTLNRYLANETGKMIFGMTNYMQYYSGSEANYEMGRVVINDDLIANIIRKRKDTYGVVAFDTKANLKWKLDVEHKPIYLNLFYGNLLVITCDDHKGREDTRKLYCTIVNPVNGKTISTKELNLTTSEKYTEPKFLYNKTTNDFFIALRETNRKLGNAIYGSTGHGELNDYSETKSLSVYLLDKQLAVKEKIDIAPSFNHFIGCEMDADNNLYWLTQDEDKAIVTVEKINLATKEKQRLDINLYEGKKRGRIYCHFNPSAYKKNTVVGAFGYDNNNKNKCIAAFKADFNQNKTAFTANEYSKDYRNDLMSKYKPNAVLTAKPTPKHWDDMSLTEFKETENSIIAISDVTYYNVPYQNSNTFVLYGEETFVACFDVDNLALKYNTFFTRDFMNYAYSFDKTYTHVKGNNLHILTNSGSSPTPYYLTMDINTGTIKNIRVIEHKGEIAKYFHRNGGAIWLKDMVMLDFITPSYSYNHPDVASFMDKMAYDDK